MAVAIAFYDATVCIGGNKVLLEDESAALLLDFGTNFKAEGMRFASVDCGMCISSSFLCYNFFWCLGQEYLLTAGVIAGAGGD